MRRGVVIRLVVPIIISGVVELKKADTTSQLDYGDGECDDKATLTRNGKSYEIQIRKKKRN